MNLKNLAREYAALVPDWARPGMRCVDPETGNGYRKRTYGGNAEISWMLDTYGPDVDRLEFLGGGEWWRQHRRAIAAGPDLDDDATLGALLLGLEDTTSTLALYFCVDRVTDDRSLIAAEAIINACIAQAKEQP